MHKYKLAIGGKEFEAEILEISAETARVVVNGQEYTVELKELGRKPMTMTSSASAPAPAAPAKTPERATAAAAPRSGGDSQSVNAPLPGLIIDIMVNENDSVKAGQNLLLMEAMKMENQIPAPYDGTVKRIHVKKGDSVSEGDVLIEINRPPMTTL
ncbi:MAG: biotin/lipoyl-containing protein [Acidobacteriota bacterium]|jgi:biotin carboxyl carrier protein|nr:biotin/lipoyl-containing protein [Acidobacteriota bacterium]